MPVTDVLFAASYIGQRAHPMCNASFVHSSEEVSSPWGSQAVARMESLTSSHRVHWFWQTYGKSHQGKETEHSS